MPEIKNIIFDLGAVLIDIDFNRVNNSFLDLGISNFNNQYSQLLANKLFKKTIILLVFIHINRLVWRVEVASNLLNALNLLNLLNFSLSHKRKYFQSLNLPSDSNLSCQQHMRRNIQLAMENFYQFKCQRLFLI
jgi:hypothetical protein